MATKSSVRVAFRVAGAPRRLFSLGINKSGSVFISFKSDGMFRDLGIPAEHIDSVSDLHRRAVREQRYSVHPSENSADGINYIHHHLILDGVPEIETTHLTKAIKSSPPRFALLFARRCATLTTDTHKPESRGANRTVCLDEFDSKKRTLFYCIAVSAENCSFPDQWPDVNVWQYPIGKFRFVVLWSFFECGAIPASVNSHFLTPNEGILSEDALERLRRGGTPEEAIDAFRHVREIQKEEMVSVLARATNADPLILNFLRTRKFLRRP